jgi:hypothetical protein
MNPKPLSALNHFTVPEGIVLFPYVTTLVGGFPVFGDATPRPGVEVGTVPHQRRRRHCSGASLWTAGWP